MPDQLSYEIMDRCVMTEDSKIPTDSEIAPASSQVDTRRLWSTPRVETLRAGDAEVGTRSNVDGAFSTS